MENLSAAKKQYFRLQDNRVLKLVEGMTLFDDDLMTLVFDQNVKAVELVLRIILGRPVHVKEHHVQEELRNPVVDGRNITLDVLAVEDDGTEIDIEVQGNSAGANVKRARFHSASMDYRMLKKNEDLGQLRDSYVIFIYKHDKFGKGLPIYIARRVVDETGESLDDGSYIIYVNGAYKGNDEIGMLMQDFHSLNSEGMNYKELADGMQHFKETGKGRDTMCEAVEEYAKEYAIENKILNVKNLMENMNWTLDQTLTNMGITDQEREIIIQQLQK
ncbi:MAG: PD-(D/E)XK nuclease family transposase [Lachnospiraceae bacterium]|nr:PD-(D/E)XK nuclease family transposase [Lachnospiraceae bacterium]